MIVIGLMPTDITPMRFPRALIIASLLVLAGCSSTPGTTLRPVPIAGGKVVGIPFGPNGPVSGQANGYQVLYATLVPGEKPSQVVYRFAFGAPPSTKLQRVVVDDISDEQSSAMIDDGQPWLDEKNMWRGEMKPLDNKDPLLAWVYTVTPSMRVFRFIITDSAGKQTTLYQLTGFPPYIKAAMRFSWGEKY